MGERSGSDVASSTPPSNSPTSAHDLDSSGSSGHNHQHKPALSNGHSDTKPTPQRPSSRQSPSATSSPHNSSGLQNPQYTVDYLAQLLKDKNKLAAFPNIFHHLERLVDDEITKVRVALFQFEFTKEEEMVLPDPEGEVTVLQEKVFVPAKDHPDYNFVGRILGPRGMTAKQLETETGCKIMVRGKGSMRDKKKEESNRGKQNWEHLNDELHVLVQCEDTVNRAKVKLARAVSEIRKLLVPAPEGEDELKRKQLMELAIINGTYRPASQPNKMMGALPGPGGRMLTPMSLASSSMRSPSGMAGAPIILSPTRGQQLPAGISMTPCSTTSMQSALAGLASPYTPVSSMHQPSPMNGNALHHQQQQAAIDYQHLLANGLVDQALLQSCYNPMYAGANQNNAFVNANAAAAAVLFGAGGNPFLADLGQQVPGVNQQQQFQPGAVGFADFSPAGAILNNQRRVLGTVRNHPYERKLD